MNHFLSIAFALCVCAAADFQGDATYYGATGGGACSYDKSSDSPLLVAALNNPQWAGSAWCGMCVQITGPKGTVVVKIVDKCPECKSGDLDLSEAAFVRLTEKSVGRQVVTWHTVQCATSGSLQYKVKEGANTNWVALQVRNSPVAVSKLEIKPSGATEWTNMQRMDYNYFLAQFGGSSGISLPASLRTTSCNGEVITEDDILSAIKSSAITTGTKQFYYNGSGTPQAGRAAALSAPYALAALLCLFLLL
eukprot:m51a1_g2928 hypothetical protein (250) ;mRNA; r:565888-566910